jgi:hypothetical protein
MATPATLNKARRRQFQSLFDRVTVVTAVIDPVTLDAAETVEVDITGVTGAALGDIVLVGAGVDNAIVAHVTQVTAADTLTITLFGPSTGNVNLASSTWNFVILRIRADLKANG